MKIHDFYFSYVGGKNREMKYIDDIIDNLDKETIKNIIEPFAGSSAFSRYMFFNKEYNKCNYIINDNDKELIDFYKQIKKNGSNSLVDALNKKIDEKHTKETHKKLYSEYKETKDVQIKNTNLYILKKFCFKRIEIFSSRIPKKKEYYYIDNFYNKYNNLKIYNDDFIKIIDKYKNDSTALIFLDPPYFDSFNSVYFMYEKDKTTENKIKIDNTKMYIDILEYLKNCKCKIIMIINSNKILDYLYKDYIKKRYNKTYQMSKKNTEHIVCTNF